MHNGHDLDSARDALHALDPGCTRDEWVKLAMASKAAGIDLDTFDAWSAQAANYSERDARAVWHSIRRTDGIGPGTLFKAAAQAGWTPESRRPRVAPTKAAQRPAEPRKAPRPGTGAAEVWARCKPAPADHPYIVAKNGRPDGLRVVPAGDPLRVFGESVAGCIAVPLVPLAGDEPVSLQFVPTPETAARWKAADRPGKLTMPGPMGGGVFIVGDMATGGTVFVCEGIATAWACWTATGGAAVVCFGWGRVRAVAGELRQRDASARLVLVPDAGKEDDAERIACDVGAAVAAMPQGEPPNFDANDYSQREGFDALEVLLSRASEPARPEPTPHPLARYVDLDAEPMAPRFVIPGFIGYGLVIFAGTHGVGKTTALLPLAMVAAGLHGHGDPLAPKQWRHVVYITEDAEQARRIVAGVVKFGGLGLDVGTVRERLHIVEARRLEPSYVAEVATTYREQFARIVDGVEVPPLVVMDTKSAVFSIDEENSNSEASAIVAVLKQSFENLPVWLVGHVAKANMSRGDVAGLALRGASAFEADANQVLYLAKDGEARYLVRGKTRFEAAWPELQIESKTAATMARDEYGDLQPVTLRWGIAAPPEQSRKEAQEEAQEAARKADAAALRDEVRGAIDTAWLGGFPLNREGVKAIVKRNRAEVTGTMESLLAERWLHEVAIPAKERTNPKRAAFLVNLTTEEHEAAVRGEGMPPAKVEVPASWRKPVAPSVPDSVPQEVREVAHASHE